MRCTITYRMGRFSSGSMDFGVTGEDDPRVAREIAKLKSDPYIHSVKVRFY